MRAGPSRADKVIEALGLIVARRRGRRAWMHCPFHDPEGTRTTSAFFVRTSGERAGNYHCFSCKVSGSLTALTAHVRGLTIEDARAFVADAGKGWRAPTAKVRFVSRPANLVRRGFYFPTEVVIAPLEEWDTLPRRYAVERGITNGDVAVHGIGYAVEGPLAGRIVFPVRSAGRIVSYTARTFVDEEPRYKTPREDEHPDLDAIFGMDQWPRLDLREEIVITEGAIDALAVNRVVHCHAGSLGGSDVRPGHIIELATWKTVIVLTDHDPAGDKAAKILRSSLGRHVRTERVLLPAGKDAAVLAMRSPDLLRREIDRALRGAMP